jgi:thiamine-monophosphate kinase
MVRNMKLRELGERNAQNIIRNILSDNTNDKLEIEDDCAALDFGEYFLLITTDLISQSTHIPQNATPWQIGWHVTAINLSDIASMGGEPIGLVVALGLPASYDEEFLSELVKGAHSCATKFKTSILGGDTKESESLTLSGCALGRVLKSEIMKRKGAKPGDLVCVTGELGKAGCAYYSLENDPENEGAIKDLLEVTPRIIEGRILAQSQAVTSCMDISDGLASSIHQLSQLNSVGFEVDIKKLPVYHKAQEVSEKLNIQIEDMTVYFGGDYELLLTVKESKVAHLKKEMAKTQTRFSEIGRVVETKTNTLIKDDISSSLEDRGYEHFRWNK